ncbi:MAG TPA: ABC transporter permease [Thermoanaerobaculia bacterium]|nr:ABC transporter permease [Thermoanaerobaculia bacterium]
MEKLLQDLRYGLRGLLHRPGFTLVALVSLALGIGANTAIFTLLDTVFLQPLPVAGISRLAVVYTVSSDLPGYLPISQPNFVDYRDQAGVFSDLALVAPLSLSLSGNGRPEQISGQLVSARYFQTLGVRPVLGRTFLPEEDRVARPVVILGHGLWRRRFGSDPHILGRPIRLNGRELVVVGVAPGGFYGTSFVNRSDFWVPAGLYGQVLPEMMRAFWTNRRVLGFSAVGRLKPGMSLEQGQAALKSLADKLAQEYPDANRNRNVALLSLSQSLISPNDRQGYVRAGGLLATMVGLVLLIACANLANMLLVRASGRRKEIAVRLALGGRRADLIRQLLTESLLLSLAAGASGLLLAAWSFTLLSLVQTPYLPDSLELALDGRVLLFTLGLSLVTALLFGLVPALAASRPDLVPALKNEVAAATGGVRRFGLRNLLIVGQVGLSVVALVGAVLFLLSLRNALRIDPGFEREHLAVLSFDLDSQGFDEARGQQLLRQMATQAAALPGVRGAAIGENLMLSDTGVRHILLIDSPAAPADRRIVAQQSSVGPGYFETLGIPILRGRALDATDRADSRPVVVVNETLAERFWPHENPLGKRFGILPSKQILEIVGVARDLKYNTLGEEPQLYLYRPLAQEYTPSVTLHVRTQGEPGAVLGAARREVQALVPEMPLTRVKTMPAVIGELLWAPRVCAVLLVLFGAVALLLVTIGVYGVIAHSIAQRQREIGIRMALGAQRADVVRLFLRQGIQAVAVGLACGLVGALLVVRTISGLLFGIDPMNPIVFLVTILLLAVVAAIANYIPTRRATAVSPLVVMRQE